MTEGRCDTGFIWNPSNCECECDINDNIYTIKILSVGKKLVWKISWMQWRNWWKWIIYNETLNDYGNLCNSCIINIVL